MSDTLPHITVKPPFLYRAITCSLILACDTQILGKRASRNKVNSIALVIAEGVADFRVPHTGFLAFSIGRHFFGGPAFEFKVTDLVSLQHVP